MKLKNMNKATIFMLVAGGLAGLAAVVLHLLGNPANMGLCIACFLRDTAGALKLHSAPVVQYLRPEIPGIILGAFLVSLIKKEFRPKGGSAPMTRFIIGVFVMIGALAFLGCPFRMVLRMAAGDLNAWIGLVGFVGGVFLGTLFLRRGFSLRRAETQSMSEGLAFPVIAIVMAVAGFVSFSLLAYSETGPGSMHAPVLWSFLIAAVVGVVVQRSRLCQTGGIRDAIMIKDFHLLWGSVAIFVVVLIANIVTGKFNLSMTGHHVAHSDTLWNILGLGLVGFGSVLLGGCPLRQLVLAGTGNSDSAITVLGMIAGAAFAHNFGLAGAAANAESAGGVGTNGRIAVIVGFVVILIIAFSNIRKQKN